MTNFYFKAVAADGKLRTGTLHADDDKWVARELRKQGLTPVYVGLEPKKSFEPETAVLLRTQTPRRPLLYPGNLDPPERQRAS